MYFSYEAAGTLMMDTATIFFLGGILVYTAMYRRRGQPDDKLYFYMLVLDLIMASVEVVNYLMLESNLRVGAIWINFGDTIFHICFEVFPFLYIIYLDYIINESGERIRKKWWLYGLPCFASVIMVILNLPFKYLFSASYLPESGSNIYVMGDCYKLVFVAVALYCLLAVIMISRVDLLRMVTLGIIIGTRIVWGFWFRGVSSTAFLFSVILAYSHIITMNSSFREENL